MRDCIEVMRDAMLAVSSGTISIPQRFIMPLIDESGYFAVMPGSSLNPRVYGAKVVSLHPGNPAHGRPPIQGFVTLFDHDSGTPLAIVEGGTITAIRTAAASALATQVLAREDSRTCGILGTGIQAASHIDAIACVLPILEFVVWGRTAEKARRLAEELSVGTGLKIHVTRDPAESASCDIVCTVTGSKEPVLKGKWLRSGAHINLVGAHAPTAREADSEAILLASVYVDSRESAMTEAGDLLIPLNEGLISREHVKGEIGEVIAGHVEGRTSRQQITLYKSLGLAAQDLYAAHRVYERSRLGGSDPEISL